MKKPVKYPLPEDIRCHILAAQEACNRLVEHARGLKVNRKFTLDGRCVGDIGELIAAQVFDMRLHDKQRSRHDAECTVSGRTYGVQVKCRRKSTVVDVNWQPDLFLIIEIDDGWTEWEVVYNGPGDFLSKNGYTADEGGRLWKKREKEGRRIYLEEFRERQLKLPQNALRVPLKS